MRLRENTSLQEVNNYESFDESVNIQQQKKIIKKRNKNLCFKKQAM